eukprot:gene18429-37356_t
MDWLNLFLYYMSLSLLAVGGAIATAPDMHRFLVERQAWLTDPQFNASIAIAQAAPGPNVLFIALLGWNVGINAGGPGMAGWLLGALGMAVCMLGVMLPSSLLTWLATRWGHRNRELRAVRAFKQGMAPIVIALLVATGTGSAAAGAAGAVAVGGVAMSADAGSLLPQKVSALGQMAQPDSSSAQTIAVLAIWPLRTMRVRREELNRMDMGRCFLGKAAAYRCASVSPKMYRKPRPVREAVQDFFAVSVQRKLVAHQVLDAMGIGNQQAVVLANAANILVAAQHKLGVATVRFYLPGAGCGVTGDRDNACNHRHELACGQLRPDQVLRGLWHIGQQVHPGHFLAISAHQRNAVV